MRLILCCFPGNVLDAEADAAKEDCPTVIFGPNAEGRPSKFLQISKHSDGIGRQGTCSDLVDLCRSESTQKNREPLQKIAS